MPDIERMLSKIYTYSVKSKVKAIYIDIAIVNRLNEFYKLINILKKAKNMLDDVFDDKTKKNLMSKRLLALGSLKELDFNNNSNDN
jgi:hypothetical protein